MEHTQIVGFDAMLEPLVAALNRLAAAQERIAAAHVRLADAEEVTAESAKEAAHASGVLAAFQAGAVKAALDNVTNRARAAQTPAA